MGVVQARLGSTRLPGKMLLDLAGEPLLVRVVERAQRVNGVTAVVVATTDRPGDDPLVSLCEERGFPAFRGDEQDVLDRYCGAAAVYGADHVMRITGDAAFFDPGVAAETLALHLETGADYTHSITAFGSGFPAGVGSELFTRAVLEASCVEADDPFEREHVDEYVHRHPDWFRISELKADPVQTAPDLDLSIDVQEDLDLAREIYRALGPHASLDQVLRHLRGADRG